MELTERTGSLNSQHPPDVTDISPVHKEVVVHTSSRDKDFKKHHMPLFSGYLSTNYLLILKQKSEPNNFTKRSSVTGQSNGLYILRK